MQLKIGVWKDAKICTVTAKNLKYLKIFDEIQGPNSGHGQVLGRLQAAIVIGFEWRNSSCEPIQVKGWHVF